MKQWYAHKCLLWYLARLCCLRSLTVLTTVALPVRCSPPSHSPCGVGCTVSAPVSTGAVADTRLDFARIRRLRSPDTFLEPASAGPGAVSPINVDCHCLAWFNTPYHRRWYADATKTPEPAARSVPCSTCAVLGTFAGHLLETCKKPVIVA